MQLAEQPSASVVLPSSQTSPISLSRTPLPHFSNLQRAEQNRPEPGSILPGVSQSSFLGSLATTFPPASLIGLSSVPLPHFSVDRQFAEQPSPSSVLPSSQTSSGSWRPSPQVLESGMQMPWSAAQWVPDGHRMPVLPHSTTAGV